MNMIEVDGSFGEGGGQVLRSAISLSAILGKSVRITGIRKNRPRPGLSPQSLNSIKLVQEMTGAKAEGLVPGSSELTFIPGTIKGGNYSLNVGTAGSITIILQCVLPVACFAPGPVSLNITGGTDVKWAPPFDYFKNVTLKALGEFGVNADVSLVRRGFFPRGGGSVVLNVMPSTIRKASILQPEGTEVTGVSSSSRLPPHVVERQADSARKYLGSRGIRLGDIRLDIREDDSTGSCITLFKGFLGSSSLGERGVSAEKVGMQAAERIYNEITSGAAVDSHLADQLIPYMALAEGSSIINSGPITSHTRTNMHVVELMTGRKFDTENNGRISIRS